MKAKVETELNAQESRLQERITALEVTLERKRSMATQSGKKKSGRKVEKNY